MSQEYRQERPSWCPKTDCIFIRRAMDAWCGGELPELVPHDGDFNTHRICWYGGQGPDPYMVNENDLDWLRWILDALDGKKTSWLSKREGADDRR